MLFIGFTTRQKLKRLERDGDVPPSSINKFYHGVHQYYEAATKYIIEKLMKH